MPKIKKAGLKYNKTRKGKFIEVHCFGCGRELKMEQLYKNYKKSLKHLVYVRVCDFCLKSLNLGLNLSPNLDLKKAFEIITEMELWNEDNVVELRVNEVYQLIQDSTMKLRKALGDE